jgi:hypothetical protein
MLVFVQYLVEFVGGKNLETKSLANLHSRRVNTTKFAENLIPMIQTIPLVNDRTLNRSNNLKDHEEAKV